MDAFRASPALQSWPPDAGDGAAMRRARWRARRGLLENDLLLERFFARHGAGLGGDSLAALGRLLDLPDGQLLELLLGSAAPPPEIDSAPVREVLALVRSA